MALTPSDVEHNQVMCTAMPEWKTPNRSRVALYMTLRVRKYINRRLDTKMMMLCVIMGRSFIIV